MKLSKFPLILIIMILFVNHTFQENNNIPSKTDSQEIPPTSDTLNPKSNSDSIESSDKQSNKDNIMDQSKAVDVNVNNESDTDLKSSSDSVSPETSPVLKNTQSSTSNKQIVNPRVGPIISVPDNNSVSSSNSTIKSTNEVKPMVQNDSSKLKNLTTVSTESNPPKQLSKKAISLLNSPIPNSLSNFHVPGLDIKKPESLSSAKSSQVKQIEASVYEETSEFKSANVIRNSTTLNLKKIYEVSQEWMTFTVEEDYFERKNKFHLIVIKGSGTLYIRTEKSDKSAKKHVKVSLDSSYEMTYIPVNTMYYLSKKGDTLQLKIERGLLGLIDTPEVKIDLVEYISMEFNQNHRVITKLKEKVPYKVVRPDLHVNHEGKDDRLQFILQSSLSDQELKGGEEISMYINRKQEFPTQSRYDFMATGNMGYGLIKSLHKGNQNYCISKNCDYYVSLYSKNVDFLFFFPTVFANESKLKFHRYLYLLEEVEGEEIVTYELDVPEHEGDWAFIIQPIEGFPQMFINPDTKPNSIGNYKYKTVGEKAEQITITYEQAKQYNFSHKKFFVSFTGTGESGMVASFKFEVRKIADHTAKFIKMNYAETGVVANKEIVQYKLHFEVDQPEFINFEMSLVGVVGKTLMIVKECENERTECKVTQEDVDICKMDINEQKNKKNIQNEKMNLAMNDGIPGRMLQDSYSNMDPTGFAMPQPAYQQPNNPQYAQQGGYYNPYETDYNAPVTQPNRMNTNLGGYQPKPNRYQNRQFSSSVPNQGNAQRNQGYNYPHNNLNNPGSSYIPKNNYNSQGYYRDMPNDPNQNFSTQDMVTQNDIKQAEREEQKYLNKNNGYQGLNQYSSYQNPNYTYQMDKNLKPFAPNQENLTSMSAKRLEETISDPFLGKLEQEKMMKMKDKELEKIKDYQNLNRENFNANKVELPPFKNLDKQFEQKSFKADDSILKPLPKVLEKPKGYKYDLNNKLKKDKLKCVLAEPVNHDRDYKAIPINFNCIGISNSNKGSSFEQLDNRYPFFKLCQFSIGIYGFNEDSNKLGGSFYSINGRGGNSHKDVPLKKSKEFIIEEMETKYLRFDLKDHEPSPNAVISAKIVAITGTCDIFFSKFNKFPSKKDNEAQLNFSNEHFMSVRTSEKSVNIPFDTWGNYSSLFVTIKSKEYCVLDFYVEKLSKVGASDGLKNEKLKMGKMVKRKITTDNFIDTLSSVGKRVYGRSFHFEGTSNILFGQETKITINSTVLGFKLCLQRGNKEFDPEQECDLDSHTGVIEIPSLISLLDPGMVWSVGVLLEVKDEDIHHIKLPVEFSIVCSNKTDAKETLEILNPGRVFESHISKHETIIFKMNLLTVDERSLIILTSEDKSLKAEISMNKRDFSSPKFVLDSEKYAVELNHMEQDILCEREEDGSCIFYIRVTTKSSISSRFSLIYTVDDIPITLKQGSELFIPNKDNMYFLYDPNPLFPAEFNLESDHTQFVVYAKLVELKEIKKKPLEDILSEMKYDFKTDIGREEQLRIPQKLIERASSDAVIAYLVAPKFGKLEFSSPTTYYQSSSTTRIHVKSKMSKLSPYVEGRAVLNKGEFRHFYFNVDNAKDFSLIMTVQSGNADLYLNKGLFNLPTLKSYWKRSIGSKEEEMAITTNMFNSPDKIKGVYTAGIFAKANCRVAVVYLPSFDNLIKIKPQKLLNMKLRKNQDYYFEFYNKLPTWDLDIFAENSDLSISIMDYSIQKNKDQDLVDMLKDPNSYFEHFSFIKGSLPLQHRENNAKLNKHYVVKVKATEHDAPLNIMIYEPGKPIQVPAKKRYTFVGNKDETHIFKIELTGDYEKVKMNFKLEFGNVEFSYSNDLDDLMNQGKTTLSLPVVKSIEYDPPSKPSDIDIFDTFFLKVDCKEFSKFNFVVRGAEKFIEIKPFETEIIHLKKNEEQNVYFYISKNIQKSTHSMTIDINTVNFYNGRPKFYFNPDGQNEIELDAETKYLPMPINDINDKVSGEFRHLEIKPSIENGYYIINFPASKHHLPVKISIGMNHRRSLEVNGVYRYQLPARTDPAQKFSMYLPYSGEFRFLVESCKKVEVNRAELTTYNAVNPILFQENLVQASHFILYDDTKSGKPQRIYKNYVTKVFRGVNEFPGVLNFTVDKRKLTEEEDKGLEASNKDYLLLTEFKPKTRNLFFKDYLNLWGDKEDENMKQYNYQWSKNRKSLEVDLYVPKFHEQLLIDFPDLKKIVIKFFVHLFADDQFIDRIDLCGLAAVEEIPHVRLYHTEVVQVQTELNKKKPLIFHFNEEDLEKFGSSKKLNVFTYMSISFFESEMEEFEVELEMKFANVPYFLFITKNLYGRSSSYFFLGFVVFCILSLIGFIGYLRNQNKMNENDVRSIINKASTSGYANPNNPEGTAKNDGFVKINDSANQIQMSEMSSLSQINKYHSI